MVVATGSKEATGHPLDPLDDFTGIALAAGTALFVAADAAMLRLLRIARSPAQVAAAVAALATIPLGLMVSAAAQVAALAVIVALPMALGGGLRAPGLGRAG